MAAPYSKWVLHLVLENAGLITTGGTVLVVLIASYALLNSYF